MKQNDDKEIVSAAGSIKLLFLQVWVSSIITGKKVDQLSGSEVRSVEAMHYNFKIFP
jgi:hypothetical protein